MKFLVLLTFFCFAFVKFIYSPPPPLVVLTFTTVTPDPVIAGTNLTVFVDSGNVPSTPINITLHNDLFDTNYTAVSMENVQLLIPTDFYGVFDMFVTLFSETPASTQNGTQTVEVVKPMVWTSPNASEYYLAGTDISILITSDTTDLASIQTYLIQNSTSNYLTNAYFNEPTTATLPISYPRGPTYLNAVSVAPNVQPESNITIFINTTVTYATPSDGDSFVQNSTIAVVLGTYDGLGATCSVKMTCSNGYNITQTVTSPVPTYFVSPLPGTCILNIIAVVDEYVDITHSSAIVIDITPIPTPAPTPPPFVNPTGGEVYPLSPEQSSAFAISISFSSPVVSSNNQANIAAQLQSSQTNNPFL